MSLAALAFEQWKAAVTLIDACRFEASRPLLLGSSFEWPDPHVPAWHPV